jgi:hypothetical protein
MDDHISVVHQYPVAESQSFNAAKLDAFFLQSFFDLFLDCLYLCGTFPRTDYEVIRDSGQAL